MSEGPIKTLKNKIEDLEKFKEKIEKERMEEAFKELKKLSDLGFWDWGF